MAPRDPRPAGEDPDAALVERARAGDAAAFTTLVRRHGPAVQRVARLFVRDPASAEEVAADAWLAALEGLPRFEGRAAFRSWLLGITANKGRTRGVRDARAVPFSALASAEAQSPAEDVLAGRFDGVGHWRTFPAEWHEDSPEALTLRQETRGVLERAIGGLSEAQRAVITLRDLEGLPSEEVCNLLGVTETNQRVLLHRARTRVRAELERHLSGDRETGETEAEENVP
ncbi:MAG: sigma-70 family RNA polymerase sigma factor [Anaeromyxobacter sp.]